MAYHSAFNDEKACEKFRQACGCPLVPLNTGPSSTEQQSLDPVDEALELFRANALFKTFDVRGPGDKLLVYLILFINSCLRRLADRKPAPGREEARALLFAHAHDRFSLPGQAGFPLGALMQSPAGREEEEAIRSYLRQCREEAARRLLDRLYGMPGAAPAAAAPHRHWMAYANRRFLDRAM
ncbi:hypothetical protein HYH03_017764 [Edaphochlamys debaryana]|uniref:Actin-related protein 2/3 complex subunit 3 n=1 Tax=Edaphochlamys debaryana TaxID=47281 RepID=A0A835XLV2_9CHLO|nr:hypothetical protein HYH03_017764 [Edaphochlamys debaryana]|eukprot:KAG2483365.1 hypothetical protein HYH03_017764 [Edaphochlamys debaryana]